MESDSLTIYLPTLLCAAGLAIVHLTAGKLRFLRGMPRSRWLSIAGGVSVAYVFMHMLPELNESQAAMLGERAEGGVWPLIYLLALSGLVIFYGLERLTLESASGENEETPVGIFWLHLGSFAIYNAIVGEAMTRRAEEGVQTLIIFFVAMTMHFVVNDYGLQERHEHRYSSRGRWLLATAVLVGWAVGAFFVLHEAIVFSLFAVLAGGIVLNVLKEELPEERQSRFIPFLLGATVFAGLVLLGY